MNPEFLSGEASASPAVESLLAGARRLDALGFGTGALAARNGPRTTTHANLPFSMLSAQDFVEVADYDPHLDRLMCIGRREPHPQAGMIHLILRAKKELGAVVLVEAEVASLPQAKPARSQLDRAMSALEALRGRDAVALGKSVIVTGRTADEAIGRAVGVLGGPSASMP